MDKSTFLMCKEWEQHINLLSKEQRGELLSAIMAYQNRMEIPEGDPTVVITFSFMRAFFDKSETRYADKCDTNRKNGQKGGKPKIPTVITETEPKRNNPTVITETEPKPEQPSESLYEYGSEYEYDSDPPTEGESTGAEKPRTPTPAEKKPIRAKRGQYGWVKLTDGEYSRLLNDLGEAEVKRCVAYIDESAQSNGNKNHWRDWNLVIRKCSRDGWGLGRTPQRDVPIQQGGRQSWAELAAEMDAEEGGL